MAPRWTALALGALLLATAAGCVHYAPQPIAPAHTAAALESRRLSDPGLIRFLHAQGVDVANSPVAWTLHSLTVAGLYFNPRLAVARADWAVARATVRAAGGRPNPTLDLNVAAITSGATPSPSVLSLLLGIPIVTAGKRGIRIAEARDRSDAQRLGIATAAWSVRAAVRNAAITYWASTRGVALSRTAVGDETQLVALLEHRLAAGDASSLDVGREQIALDRARAGLRDDERRLAASRVQLATAVGVPVEALDSTRLLFDRFTRPLPTTPDRADARTSAMLARSDVRAALATYAAAQAALQLEVARQYPNLILGLGLHWEQELHGLTITPSSALPILNRNRGPIAEAEARRTAAAARFTQLQAGVLARVDRALAEYGASRRALQSADSAAILQHSFTERVEARFRAGEVDRVALESARAAAVATDREQLAARTQALMALGALESATQKPLLGEGWSLPQSEPDSTRETRTR